MTDRKVLTMGVAAILLILLAGGAFALTMMFDNDARDNLDGRWVGGPNQDAQFEAVIDGDHMEIEVNLDGLRGTYWIGDLNIDGGVENGDTLYSKANQAELEYSLLGSQLDEKEFYFVDGKIVFEYGILGTTQDIELEEQ